MHTCKCSKNEIYFAELCRKKFKNVLLNRPIFDGWDADVILQDQKIAILWNGPWHYKQLFGTHSLKQVQNRDKLKLQAIKASGYKPYIIEDTTKKPNLKFVEEQFTKFLQATI